MMAVDDEAGVVLVGEDGTAARREMAGFGAHPNAGNRGKVLGRFNTLVAAVCAGKGGELWLLTAAGKLLSVPVKWIPSGPGPSKGKTVVNLGRDRLVALAVRQDT
jgi:hypothetical protein